MANKTMHHVVIGSDTYEIVDQYAREHGASIDLDTTLTEAGKAADAKAVGDALADKADSSDVTALDERVTALEAGGGGGNPFDIPTATNLITILRKCVFSEDVSTNIENLAEALGVNSGGDDDDMTFTYGQSIPKGNIMDKDLGL